MLAAFYTLPMETLTARAVILLLHIESQDPKNPGNLPQIPDCGARLSLTPKPSYVITLVFLISLIIGII